MGHHQAAITAISIVTETLATDRLRVVYTPGKGRGVLANRDFEVGEVIEVVPVLVVKDSELVDRTELENYVYAWPAAGDNAVAVAFGCGSLYNHSYAPNARYDKCPEDGGFGTIRYTAIRRIAAGDEIVINYNGDPADQSPMWFDLAPTT